MADETLTFYYFPLSYYSQLVRIALEERELKYKETYVNLLIGRQNEEKYLKINPQGMVPMLKIGDAIVPESEHILDAIDKLESSKGKSLIPDESTESGKLVSEWRKKLKVVDAYGLLFGVALNPELHDKEPQMLALKPGSTKEGHHENIKKSIAGLETLKEKCPDLAGAIDAKIVTKKAELDYQLNKEDVEKVLDGVDKMLSEAETQLRKSRTANILEHWLCGADFTVADIYLCILLGRLDFSGLLEKYVNADNRPALVEYWTKLQQRPSVKKCMLDSVKEISKHEKTKILQRVAGGLAGGTAVAGAAVLLGSFVAKKYL